MFSWFRELLASFLVLAAMICVGIALISIVSYGPGGRHLEVKYDCRIAEISPDVPQEVKTRCRNLMRK